MAAAAAAVFVRRDRDATLPSPKLAARRVRRLGEPAPFRLEPLGKDLTLAHQHRLYYFHHVDPDYSVNKLTIVY
jgi:hypothetical protein